MSEFLEGVELSTDDQLAILAQRGRTLKAKWPGTCKICKQPIDTGDPLECCTRFGWVHAQCRQDSYREAGGQ